MAEYGEWNRQGATLSDGTAQKEYDVDRDFIVRGIRAGQLEYRQGAVPGNPYLRLLRSPLERYIAEALGADYWTRGKNQTEHGYKIYQKAYSHGIFLKEIFSTISPPQYATGIKAKVVLHSVVVFAIITRWSQPGVD